MARRQGILSILFTACVLIGCDAEEPGGIDETPLNGNPPTAEQIPPSRERPPTQFGDIGRTQRTEDAAQPVDAAAIDPAPTQTAEPGLPDSPPAASDDPVEPFPVFRPSDSRPMHDRQRAAELGIRAYESRRLLLFTDIDPAVAETLPPLMDQVYAAWTDYFGELPPDREGSDYQLTGYIMEDTDRFLAAGMLPEEALASLIHGVHREAEFWMHEQEYEYYRRHLMLHEGTHCFMTALPDVRLPLWYLEGMAEYFGTHRLDEQGRAEFGVMPEDPAEFVGFGRVEMIREAVEAGEFRSVDGVMELSLVDFSESKTTPYAWSWAFCKFLDAHPRYRERFRELARHLEGEQFYAMLREAFEPDASVLWVEWELFAHTLEYGYDIERAVIEFVRGSPPPSEPAVVEVRADRGWQSSGAWVEAGESYLITAEGRVTLADQPRPWVSEPQGVSIRYAEGRPLGRVIAAVQSEEPPLADGSGSLLKTFDVGRSAMITPQVSGTLYLRVNDFWSELADNAGGYRVRIEHVE